MPTEPNINDYYRVMKMTTFFDTVPEYLLSRLRLLEKLGSYRTKGEEDEMVAIQKTLTNRFAEAQRKQIIEAHEQEILSKRGTPDGTTDQPV